MKRFALAAVVALTMSMQVAAQINIIRGKADDEGTRRPVFIAASDMFAADGQFSSVVPGHWQESIRHNVARNEAHRRANRGISAETAGEPCGGVYFAEADVESLVIRDSAKTTIENAQAIISGRIRTVIPGFFDASPGSLLELDELTQIKTSVPYRHIGNRLYLRHPYANFRAGNASFCAETRRGSLVPTAGDRVLLFAFAEPYDPSGTFIYSFLNDLIIEPSATGRLQVPELLEVVANETDNFDTVVRRVRALLRPDREVPVRGHQ